MPVEYSDFFYKVEKLLDSDCTLQELSATHKALYCAAVDLWERAKLFNNESDATTADNLGILAYQLRKKMRKAHPQVWLAHL